LLQSAEGEAAWSVGPALPAIPPAVPIQVSEDSGFSYRARLSLTGAPLAARLRLRERPPGFRMPLSAQMGEGADAVRVGLSRLSPLGKVAFDLSIPEISAGISAALEKVRGTDAAPGGERLADPAFAHWGTEGNEIGSPRSIPLGNETAAPLVAFAPDGRTAIGVVRDPNHRAPQLVGWDTENLEVSWRLALDFGLNASGGLPTGLAVDPGGRFVYLVLSSDVAVVDLAAPRLLGAPIALSDGAFAAQALALSEDGAQLAISGFADGGSESGPRIALFDAERLIDQVRDGAASATRLQSLDPEGDPIDLAFSPDGARLYVLTAEPQPEPEPPGVVASATGPMGRLSAHDLQSIGLPVHVLFDGIPRALALEADGSAVLVLHPNRLDRYDAETLALAEPSLNLPGQGFAALAAEPGGARALLAGASGFLAVALSAAGLRRLPVPSGAGSLSLLSGIAVSPLGDRAVALPLSDTGAAPNRLIQVIPLGTPHPLDWTVTAGRALPFSLSGAAGRGLVLGEPETASLASQSRLPTAPLGPSALSQVVTATPGRTYELSFFGMAQTEARAEVLWRAADGATLGIETLPIALRIRGRSSEPTFHRGRFTAPLKTAAAEVRFVAEDGLALLRDASFREPENALAAGDLRGDSGTVWAQQPAAASGFRIAAAGAGSRVSNAGAGTVTLRQEIAAQPGAPFELRLRSRLESGTPPLLELRFLAADGTEVGEAVGIEMPAHGFDRALALGTVPATAARAEVLLAVPAGSSARIDAIELHLVSHVRVPLTFLAEAPGELSVVGGTLAWDLADANTPRPSISPRPRPTPTGTPLPLPTPPPGAPDDCGCDEDSPAAPPQLSPTPGPVLSQPIAPIEIKGIGPRRAEILRARGIATAEALLAADPRELARVLPGVSEKMAVNFVRQARLLAG
ncbi:MAG TPA: helix-hairpin-helix domain-containing protein, partial [Thermoanaerobaculia bacterium]|nr:helix-hairpin-helix domain-containing protein [Thermoanaerobaculia bacterium]